MSEVIENGEVVAVDYDLLGDMIALLPDARDEAVAVAAVLFASTAMEAGYCDECAMALLRPIFKALRELDQETDRRLN